MRFCLRPALVLVLCCLMSGCDRPQSGTDQAGGGEGVGVLTEANFQAEVLAVSQPVLVDFWATWCGPCKIIAPIVEELAQEFQGRAKMGKVDVDTQPGLAQKYGITALPTLMIFKDGKPVGQVIGVQSKAELKGRLDKVIAGSSTPAASGQP